MPAAPAATGSAAAVRALSEQELKRRTVLMRRRSAALGEIVSVLMRSESTKHHMLSELEWLVVPAVLTGQYLLAEAQSSSNGLTAPVGVVLWASVSADVDRRLSSPPAKAPRLKPSEWKSGDILWVVEAAGDTRLVGAMIKRLAKREWQGKPVKIWGRGKDGKAALRTLASADKAREAGAPARSVN